MRVAIYPGSFDPITYGHMDIIERGCGLFDKVIVAIAKSEAKNPMFSLEDRINLAASIYENNEKIEVVGFPRKLTVDLAKDYGACAIIRGLRAVSDFEYEFQLAGMNKKLNSTIETIFLMSDVENQIISSNFVKEINNLKGNINKFVTKSTAKVLKNRF